MIKVFVFVLAALFLALLLKGVNSQFSVLLSIFAAVVLIGLSLDGIREIGDYIKSFSTLSSGLEANIKLMLKLLCITLCAQLISSLCRDSGESALASQTVLYSKVFMLLASMPLFKSVLEIIVGLVK